MKSKRKLFILLYFIASMLLSSCTKKETTQEDDIQISDEVEIIVPEGEESGGY